MAKIHKLPERDPGVGLTQRQKRILDVIRHAVDRRGYPPSLREIGDSVGPVSYTHLDVYKRQELDSGNSDIAEWSRQKDLIFETRVIWEKDHWLMDEIGNIKGDTES